MTENKRVRIHAYAHIDTIYKGGIFMGTLEDNPSHQVELRLCGRMHKSHIVICVGDYVKVELSEYDLHKGRILWRIDD